MKTIKSILIFSLVLFLSGCSMKNKPEVKVYPNLDEMIAEARSNISEIGIKELNELMNSETPYILIDVRLPEEHDKGYIPGSISIPRGVIEFRINSEKVWDEEGMYVPEKDELLVLYCKKAKRGALAAVTLKQLGYTNVKNMAGGWTEWHAQYPEIMEDNIEEGGAVAVAAEEEDSGGC